jgi:SET domain-containing protein
MDIYIAIDDTKGRCVMARRRFEAGEVIEICPVIVIPNNQLQHLDKTILYDYYFNWNENDAAIALGYGSIYNHSITPNASYATYYEDALLHINAHKTIEAHTEIVINYNHDVDDTQKVWFQKDPIK